MKTELTQILEQYAASDVARFHMPGHKGLGSACFGAACDLTELEETDNLLCPTDVLCRAQQEAAKAYGARETFFCTCGSTAGVLAMLLALPEGSTVAVQRNCHRSAYSGLALCGHRPVYVYPGPSGVVEPQEVERVLCCNPGTAALLLTRPDYFGRCADIAAIAAVCRQYGAALLVDEAHGAHFALSDALPQSAACWADAWVNSAHKTLRCPNPGAYLHCGWGAIQPDILRRALFTVHTTSPSYPVLAGLDTAWREAKQWDYEAHIARLAALKLPHGVRREWADDPTRLVLNVTGRGISGFAAERALAAAGVRMEMADEDRIVAITVPIDPDAWYNKLICALCDLPDGAPLTATAEFGPPPAVKTVMTPRQAMFLPSERKPLASVAGRVAAEAVGVYPPGSAVVAPGEVFSTDAIAYLTQCAAAGGRLFGCTGGAAVVKE